MYTVIVLAIGIAIGVVFHALISKSAKTAVSAGKAIVHDIEVETGKLKSKF